MNIAARNHCLRPMARALHGHNLCAEIAPKALSRLNFQVKQSGKFGLVTPDFAFVRGHERWCCFWILLTRDDAGAMIARMAAWVNWITDTAPSMWHRSAGHIG